MRNSTGRSFRSQLLRPWLILALTTAALLTWACTSEEAEGDTYLSWNLNKSLADYDSVVIKLIDPVDSNHVLEEVWSKKLPDPEHFPKYKLTVAKGKKFVIQIRAYNAKGELQFAKTVIIDGDVPQPPITIFADLRLSGLTASGFDLTPLFGRDVHTYSIQVPETTTTLTLKAAPMDAGNTLAINGKPAAWDVGVLLDLPIGTKVFALVVTDKDLRHSAPYEIAVTRGKVVPPESVKSVTLKEESLVLYTGEDPTALTATADPPGAMLLWSSLNETVAKVDGAGNVSPVDEGSTTISVKAGSYSDNASVEVKKAPPVLTVGDKATLKPNTELEFPIALTLTHATLVSFKHSYEGEAGWDDDDTTKAPDVLKHSYKVSKPYVARFYVKDSRGNSITVYRNIKVSDADVQLAIVSPGRDTIVNVTPILVKYDLNGTRLSKEKGLTEGKNTVTIDTLGARDSVYVTLDITPPKAPEPTVTSPTINPRPNWGWPAAIDGSGVFRLRLDNADLGQAPTTTTKGYTPTTDLAPGEHILYVQERDSAGNWSETGKASVNILAPDTTPPNAPKVNGTTPTGSAPKWTWTSNGNGGSGHYRFKLDDSVFTTGSTETDSLSHTLPGVPTSGKAYTLWVEERDDAMNWSKPGSWAIKVDLTKPTVAIATPQATGSYRSKVASVALTGTTTGPNAITKVTYKVGTAAAADASLLNGAWTIAAVTFPEGATTITITATDALNNVSDPATLEIAVDTKQPSPPTFSSTPDSITKTLKGTWVWAPGTDVGSGLAGKYQYSLDNATWTPATTTVLSDLSLTEGVVTLYVQEQDLAGNWSTSAPSSIKVDRTLPKAGFTSPAANSTLNTTKVTVTGTASDAGVGLASVILSGATGAGPVTVTNGTWTSAELTLRKGLDTIIATATDRAGNELIQKLVLTVDIPAPAVEITFPVTLVYSNKDTITLKYSVNGGAEKSKLMGLTKDGLNLLTITDDNGTGSPGTDTISVFRDQAAPLAPVLAATKLNTNTSPAWTWTPGGDAGGSGPPSTLSYQYQINAGAWLPLTAAAYTHPSPAEGTYSMVVKQMDKAGNWSEPSNVIVIAVDRTAPQAGLSWPADNYVTSAATIQLVCSENTVDKPAVATPLPLEGANTITCTSSDVAGNSTSKSITVYKRVNVLFVKSGGTGSAGTSISWATAYGSIQAAIDASGSTAAATKQIWVAKGSYTSATSINMRSGISIYGGFSAAGTGKAVTERSAIDTVKMTTTAPGIDPIFYITGTSAAPLSKDTLVGIQFRIPADKKAVKIDYVNAVYIGSSQFIALSTFDGTSGVSSWGSDLKIETSSFTGFNGYGLPVMAEQGGSLNLNDIDLSGNAMPSGGNDAYVWATCDNLSVTNSRFRDARSATGVHINGNGKSITATGNTFKAFSQAEAIKGTWTTTNISNNQYLVNF
jgi:hypothetical protein